MFGALICGSFHQQQEEDEALGSSPCSTPRKSSRKNSKDSKNNPYSTRGLDKFSALLADLEEKRAKIYSQVGSQDISLVRFAYSSSNDCIPIVVKFKDQNKQSNQTKDKPRTSYDEALDKSPIEQEAAKQPRIETEKKRLVSWKSMKLQKWRRPSHYIPVFIVFILLFLAFFGRSVAILCTSIGWYLVPTLSSTKPVKKKQLVRRYSEISVRSNKNFGDLKQKSPHDRQNSF